MQYEEIDEFDDYQFKTHETAVYPEENAIEYLTLGLVNEAGEVAGVVKKFLRGDYTELERDEKLYKELGDVMWYLSELHNCLNIMMSITAAENINKLADRKERGVLKGDGDVR